MDSTSVQKLLESKKISEVVSPRCVQADAGISLAAGIELMQAHRSGYVMLVSQGKAVGIFTETDVLYKIIGSPVDWNTPIKEFMVETLFTLTPDDSISSAIELMGKRRIYHIPSYQPIASN